MPSRSRSSTPSSPITKRVARGGSAHSSGGSKRRSSSSGRGYCRLLLILFLLLVLGFVILLNWNFLSTLVVPADESEATLRSRDSSAGGGNRKDTTDHIHSKHTTPLTKQSNVPPQPTIHPQTSTVSDMLLIADTTNMTYLEYVAHTLAHHPFHRLSAEQRSAFQLEDYFEFLQNQPECRGNMHEKNQKSTRIPIITSMANVFSDLYWQLIENFVYSMVRFGLSDCAVMVCVTDVKCMQLCAEADFPCVNFRYDQFHPDVSPLPSALEQIGELKLLHLPKALGRGVDVLMLDLDVGFMEHPMKMLRPLLKTNADVFMQRDISYVMNRSLEGWRTWYTVPMPNIGLFLCRGNERTVRMFDIAWKDYKSITKKIKHNPGKDQNKVVGAMRASSSIASPHYTAGLLLEGSGSGILCCCRSLFSPNTAKFT